MLQAGNYCVCFCLDIDDKFDSALDLGNFYFIAGADVQH